MLYFLKPVPDVLSNGLKPKERDYYIYGEQAVLTGTKHVVCYNNNNHNNIKLTSWFCIWINPRSFASPLLCHINTCLVPFGPDL